MQNAFAPILIFIGGFLMGIVAAIVFRITRTKSAKAIAEELFAENEERLKASFGDMSLNALSRSTEEFLKLASSSLSNERELSKQQLDTKKGQIDEQVLRMSKELDRVSSLVKEFERDREEKFGRLTQQLSNASEQTANLVSITGSLKEALGSSRARGQWGERMAEDVLRIAGMREGINYLKQKAVTEAKTRPDFTFLLPKDKSLNMDVKFPLDNYMKVLESDDEYSKKKYEADFLKDVRNRIKELGDRSYIDASRNTVDYILLFIPNEQVYGFIHERDDGVIDFALKQKVVLCSPMTLFAVLAVVRQAVDNFAMEQATGDMLAAMGGFRDEWSKYVDQFDRLGNRIEDVQKEFVKLTTTRQRALERRLGKVDAIRESHHISTTELPALTDNEE